MRIHTVDHQGKSLHLQSVLAAAGHTLIPHLESADLLLTNRAAWHPSFPAAKVAREARAAGIPVVGYPHGAAPIREGFREVPLDLELVHGIEQGRVAAQGGWPVVEVGWTFTEWRPWQMRTGTKILYAPPHDYRSVGVQQENHQANLALLAELQQAGFHVETRDTPQVNLTPDSDAVDGFDCVFTTSTFLRIALARGIPAVACCAETCDAENDYPYRVYPDHTWRWLAEQIDFAQTRPPFGWMAREIGGRMQVERLLDAIERMAA